MPPDLLDNPFADYLEEPGFGQKASWFARQPSDMSFNEQRLFENQFGRFQNRFLGTLGQQALSGQPPTARWDPFLSGMDLEQEMSAIPPSQRGAGTGRFTPFTTFMPF